MMVPGAEMHDAAERLAYWPVMGLVRAVILFLASAGVCIACSRCLKESGGDTHCVSRAYWYGARKDAYSYFLGRITSRSFYSFGSDEKRVVHLELYIRSSSRTWLCLGGNRLNPFRVVVSYIWGGVGLDGVWYERSVC